MNKDRTMAIETAQIEAEIRQLQEFAALEPDWNAHGAKRIAPSAIQHAIDLVRRVADATHIGPDFVAPLANGGVQLEWDGDDAAIEVEVHPDDRFSYLLKGTERLEKHDVPLHEVLDRIARVVAA
jgi:hypothetical protein